MEEQRVLTRLLETGNLRFGIGKHFRVKHKITPMKCSQPEAIEMKDLYGDISRLHAFEEGVHCLLIVVGRETSTQPQAITPSRHLSRLAGED